MAGKIATDLQTVFFDSDPPFMDVLTIGAGLSPWCVDRERSDGWGAVAYVDPERGPVFVSTLQDRALPPFGLADAPERIDMPIALGLSGGLPGKRRARVRC